MRRGAAAATSAVSWESRSSISAWRACQRRAECGLGGGGWVLERAGTVGCAGPDPLPRRQFAQRGADRFWGGSDDGIDLGAGLDSGLMPPRRGRRGPSRPGRPGSSAFPIPGQKGRHGLTRHRADRTCHCATGAAVGPVHLDHSQAVVGQEPEQPGAEAAGAFPRRPCPRSQRTRPSWPAAHSREWRRGRWQRPAAVRPGPVLQLRAHPSECPRLWSRSCRPSPPLLASRPTGRQRRAAVRWRK